MGAPTVYRWDDASAPSTGTSATAWINILEKCLVTGYGTQPAAGWTKPYDNAAGKACFRNDSVTGTGMYFAVNATVTEGTVHPSIQGYEAMSDYENGTGPMANASRTTVSNGATPIPWMIIADDRCFYWFSWPYKTYADPPAGTDRCQNMFFGDIVSLFDPDPYGCLMVANNSTQLANSPYMAYVSAAGSSTQTDWYIARRWATGTDAITSVAHLWGGGTVHTTLGSLGIPGTDPLLISKSMISDVGVGSLRGYVPGMWQTGNEDPFDTLTQTTIDGKTIMCLHVNCYNFDAYLMVEIGSGFRP